MSWPSIDHSLLSPSGRVSKRARKAALKRAGEHIFAPSLSPPPPKQSHIERLQKIANGHPDNESVQAARRLLAAHGIAFTEVA